MENEIGRPHLICTLNPRRYTGVEALADLRELQNAGMSLARINAAHCKGIDELMDFIKLLRSACPGLPVMLDLPGADNRVFGYAEPLPLEAGCQISIAPEFFSTAQPCLRVSPALWGRLGENSRISFLNGEIVATVILKKTDHAVLEVVDGGVLHPRAHINLASRDEIGFLASTSEYLQVASDLRLEYLALSMPESAYDIRMVKDALSDLGSHLPLLVAKFETLPSLQNIDPIIVEADAFFVARGDLAYAIPPEAIPLVQKQIIRKCNSAGKPVFVATQILASLVEKLNPTRAEVSDLANAILDGADGITLSEETAVGAHPLEAVQTARRIIERTLSGIEDLLLPELEWNSPDLLRHVFASSPPMRELEIQLKAIAEGICSQAWAEANAGNISLNVTEEVNAVLATSQLWFLATRAGSRFRDLARDPLPHLVLVAIGEEAETHYPATAVPTSEWVCHLLLQKSFLELRRAEKVILHTHPASVIALSQLTLFHNEDILNQALNAALPELPLYLPEGVARAFFASPGSMELAKSSLTALGKKKVLIWQNHGLVCCANDLPLALDYAQIVSKAAAILLDLLKLKEHLHPPLR